jgi:predicted KAP-like P-loop ATPase
MTEDVKGFLVFFSDKDSSKRVTLFKSFIELSIVILYSKFTYVWLFGNYDLINPSEFSDLYKYFVSGNLFICVLIFVFWFFIIRTLHYYILYCIDYLFLGVCKLVIYLLKKIKVKDQQWFKIRITPISILLFFDIIKKHESNPRHYKTGKHFDLLNNILKYLYYESKGEILKTTFQNVSLLIQFSLILLIYVSQQIHLPHIFHLILWTVLCYTFVNQLFIFFLLEEVLEKHGYKVFETMEGFKRYDHNYNSVSSSFNPDKPIFSESQNLLLKRDYFSGILSNSIMNYTDKESLVIGIDGRWGDGKTSFVNMSLERFIYNPNDKKYVLFFNPWNFTNPTELTSHFLNELKRHLKKILGSKYSDDLDSKLFLYINYITNGNFQTPKKKSVQENDTESLKKEIDRVLRNLDFKLIVVVDDLDRLTGEETRQVFRFVKLVGDFPNIIYIIPFDKQKTITECKIEEDYLKKIIQIEIKLPPVISSEIYTILNDRLKSLFDVTKTTTFNFDEWNKTLNGSLRNYIKNLRDVNRIINSLKFYLSNNYVKDLNINDFVVLTTIQIFDVGLYNFIGFNRTLFTYSDESGHSLINKGNSDIKKENIEKLKSVEKEFKVKDDEFYSVVHNLFPNLLSMSTNFVISQRDLRVNRREHRICSNFYFEKYFLYPFESDKLSKEEIETILSSSNNLEVFRQSISRLIKDGNFEFFINRFLDYLDRPNVVLDRENIIRGFLSLGRVLPNEVQNNSVFGFTPKDNTTYLLGKILREMEDDVRLKLYKDLFKNKKYDIDSLVDVYRKVCFEFGLKSDVCMDYNYIKTNFVPTHEIHLLFNCLVKRYRKSFGEMCSISNTIEHLSYWKRIDPDNKYIEILIKKHLDKDSNFISFFNKLKTNMRVQSSNYGFQSRDVYNIDYIKNFVDIDFLRTKSKEVEERITNIDNVFSNEYVLFTYNKTIFDQCLSGEIDYKDTEWYKNKPKNK